MHSDWFGHVIAQCCESNLVPPPPSPPVSATHMYMQVIMYAYNLDVSVGYCEGSIKQGLYRK